MLSFLKNVLEFSNLRDYIGFELNKTQREIFMVYPAPAAAANVLEHDIWTRVAYYAAPIEAALVRAGGSAYGDGMSLVETRKGMHFHQDIGESGAAVDIDCFEGEVVGIVSKPGKDIPNPNLCAETIISKFIAAGPLVGVTFSDEFTPSIARRVSYLAEAFRKRRERALAVA